MDIAFMTLGCKLNYAETSTYRRGFVAAGLKVTSASQKADIYLINTCSVTATADSKSKNLIRRAHRLNPDAIIVVTGCSAQLQREQIASIEGVSLVFASSEKNEVVARTLELAGWYEAAEGDSPLPGNDESREPGNDREAGNDGVTERSHPWLDRGSGCPIRSGMTEEESGMTGYPIRSGMTEEEPGMTGYPIRSGMTKEESGMTEIMPAFSSGERTRSFLKIQDGCDNFCAYCTVPYARGHSRSVPRGKVLEQAAEIASMGIKEIVLTGVNTGNYGSERGESFLSLLKDLNEVEGIERYRISSIEPNLLSQEIIDWTASSTKFQPHFHIPLQSGSDRLLKAMGRRYDTDFFRRKIDAVRSAFEAPDKPLVFFGIDVIAGLPGETDDDFETTLAFLSEMEPAFIHAFPYSRRSGTPAASMPGQVREEVKKERVARLEELCRSLHEAFIEKNRGIRETVLFESSNRDGFIEGYTGNYIRIRSPFDPGLVNELSEVII
ncbi:MAG: tRNA (N(6)-L-threonylcarbamoyladenosine(37)-C(2))-methylthiotransferase MtaB [Bacteroidales bacterium]|nr:tRNA (N(6)-L-threonylcarbamoyladenosine(37)-C(2))-methylthiotransferase MtaB [Bacteroidales bacterium]